MEIAGSKHPHAFGGLAREHWTELFPMIDDIVADVMKGESVYSEDSLLVMHRHGYTEVSTSVNYAD
jgi:hypothetical protein